MATMFVANSSLQNMEINYRLPGEAMGIRVLRVPAGCQVKFPEDLDEMQVDALAEHLQRFGGREVKDVRSITVPRALVFSVNRPMKTDQIDEAGERDAIARQEVSSQKAEEAGLSQFDQLSKRGVPVHETALEIQQLNDHGDVAEGKGKVDAEFVVSRDAGRRQAGPREGRRRR